MAQNKPILYSYFRSSCSWRVRIALALKGIDHDHKGINLLKGEQRSAEFLQINPAGEVPVFIHGNNVVSHSVAILEYLEEVMPGQELLPKDPGSRATVRAIMDSIVAGIQPLQNLIVLTYVKTDSSSWKGNDSSLWAKHWVEAGFQGLEKFLEKTHGLYCLGNDVTLADVCLLPQVWNGKTRFNVDMSKFPIISEVSHRLEELEAFKVTHPYRQPDCPENLKVA